MNVTVTCLNFQTVQFVLKNMVRLYVTFPALQELAHPHLDTGYWRDLSLDCKRYFVVAGLRVQHDDKVMLVSSSPQWKQDRMCGFARSVPAG